MSKHTRRICSSPGESSHLDSSAANFRSRKKLRASLRKQSEEGRLFPVVIALISIALISTVITCFLLARKSLLKRVNLSGSSLIQQQQGVDPSEFDSGLKDQNLDRLVVLQIDRSWFLRYLNSDFAQDHFDSLSRDKYMGAWLTQIERLHPSIRRKIGRLSDESWESSRKRLLDYGLSDLEVEQLVTEQFYTFLSLPNRNIKPKGLATQLWHAVALQRLAHMPVAIVDGCPGKPKSQYIDIPVNGVGVINLDSREIGANYLEFFDAKLPQLSIYAYEGTVLKKFSSLQDTSSSDSLSSSLSKVILVNNGISENRFRFKCRIF